ncbi:MAG: MG2 domain-containing protein [Candidatus Parcubacteria bacterium]|nr:MG2 domain-containing protein [Candidatus Parcubacteria bacterium]
MEDVFGQKNNISSTFKTGDMPYNKLGFFHLQKAFNVTTPSKTKLTYAAENWDYADLEICRLSAFNFMQATSDYYDSGKTYGCEEKKIERIDLPKKYWVKNYFDVELKKYFPDALGHYVITLTNPNYYDTDYEGKKTLIREKTFLSVTNLSVVEKKILPDYQNIDISQSELGNKSQNWRNLYWVTNLSDLNPAANVKISLYQLKDNNWVGSDTSYNTDGQGLALTGVLSDLSGAIITSGLDSTIISPMRAELNYASSASIARRIYVYTDRPIYRPSHTVYLKGISRIGYDGSYEVYRQKKLNLKVVDPQGKEILTQNLEINKFGTFDTKLILPDNAALGGYSVCIDYSGCTFFDVEEYVPAPFEVKLSTDKEEYISKEDLKMKVDANYYFGVPLSGGEVEYTLSSQNYYFDRYQDIDDKTYYEFNGQAWTNGAYEYGDKFILRNNATLDEKGKAAINQSLDTTKLFSDVKDRKSKILVFDVTAKNKDGQSVSSQKSLIMHAGDFYIGLNLNKYFLSKNEKGQWKIKTVDTNGKNVSVKNIDLSISKIDWVYQKRQGPSGGYEYIWDRTEKNVKNLKVNTGANGQGAVDFQLLEEGEYEAHAKAIDGNGNEINNYYSFYVYGSGSVAVMNTDDSDLEIKANKTNLKVGERGSVIIKSPWAKAKALITLERGKIYSYEVKEITGNLYEYGFEAKAEYFPNIFLSATLISSEPGVKFGSTEFKVNTDTYKLNINVNPDKKTYLPGEEVNAGIQVTDVNGLGKSAEVSLAVVDASVLALKGNPKKDPMAFFYSGFPLTVSTASNIKNVLKTVQIWGSETSMDSTKGGGGGSDLSTRQRGEFKDTAYWQAVINTDSSGKAQIKFKLPDNLTTWQLETIAVTEDTKLGAGYTEIMAKKNLMVVPLKPRFAISGDTFYIGAQVFNQTGKNQKINVSYQSDGLTLKDDKGIKTLSLANGANETVYFKVQAPSDIKEGTLPFALLAKTGIYEDSVAQNLKITADNSYESVATANFTSVPNYREYIYLPDNIVAGKGGLKLTASATLANYLSDSLNYLMEFPYGCTEQIASQLKTLSVLKSGLNIPNVSENVNLKKIKFKGKEYTLEEAVDLGLNELYQNQNWDGGFDYWSNQGSGDYHLTLYVLDVFSYLQKAGFNVKSDVKTRAIDFVYNKLSNDKNIESNRNNLILTLYILDKAGESQRLTSLKEKVIAALNDKAFLNERISSVSLTQLALMSNNILNVAQKNAIYKVLNNRMEIDSRGAYLASGIVTSWEYYETSIKNTALYLKVMSLNQLENPIRDKVLRWLLASRAKDGSWGSTNNTISVIDAFSDYLKWKKETEANFNFSYALDGKEMGAYEFNKKNIFSQYQETLPMSSLPINKIGVLDLKKTDKNAVKGTLYYDMALKYYLPIDQMPPRDEGFSVMRNFYALSDMKNQSPLISVKQGEVIRAHVEFVVPKERNFVMLEDYIPAGMELVNMSLATSDQSLRLDQQGQQKQNWEVEDYGSGQLISPIYQELKDDRIFAYCGNLSPGVYKFDYYARALIKGNYSHLPAQVLEMYYPENFGRNAGSYFEVK